MDLAFKIPASPGTPLFPVSPERANRQQLPGSPSRQSDLSLLQHDPFKSIHSRNSSDVQGKVAQFNNLSKEASQRRKDTEAALKRAVVGREEAESEARRLKEENRALRKELEDGSMRERKVGERVESVMEEMQCLKDTHAHSQSLYEKEVRRARKEAFKSSSNLVKLQEELKTTRNKFTLVREDAEIQRRKLDHRQQEAFTAQYELVGVQEELDQLRQRMGAVEVERDALRIHLKEEEIARVAAEGKIPLPSSAESDEFSSPKKPRRESGKENVDPDTFMRVREDDELAKLQIELTRERRWRTRAVDLVEFMKIECQLHRCSCRITHQKGHYLVKEDSEAFSQDFMEEGMQVLKTPVQHPRGPPLHHEIEPADAEPLIEFSPTTGTFRTIFSLARDPASELPTPSRLFSEEPTTLAPPLIPVSLSASPSFLLLEESIMQTQPAPASPEDIVRETDHPEHSSHTTSTISHLQPSLNQTPATPQNPTKSFPFRPHTAGASHIISNTITTTIPLADPFSPITTSFTTETKMMPYSPASTMTREQALEQIRFRRGRARSIAAGNGTPRKGMVDGRRDISAPNLHSGRKD